MPYRNKAKNRYVRRRKKRRYRRRRRKPFMSRISKFKLRGSSLLPDTTLVKLKYNETIQMANVAGTGWYQFSINSLFDPNTTGAGHQPQGFDQWSQFYSKYQVNASSIVCRPLPGDTNVTQFILYPSNDFGTITPTAAKEQPYSRHSYMTSTSTVQFTQVKQYISVKKLLARNTNSVNYTGTTATSPPSQFYWHLILNSLNGTDISDIWVDVKITFYVKFFDRKSLGTS